MTPLMLQDDLVEEIKNLFSEQLFAAPGKRQVHINVFPQNLPIADSDDDEDPIPYIIVRLGKGKDAGTGDSNHTVKVYIIIGLFDDSPDAQGHRGLLNIICKIYDRFQTNPCLANKYVYAGVFEWEIQEDGYYPLFFGVVEMDFNIPAIRREDRFT